MASREFASIKHLHATVRQKDVALTLAQQRTEAEHFSHLAIEPEDVEQCPSSTLRWTGSAVSSATHSRSKSDAYQQRSRWAPRHA
jgi:hypothetical protein